MIVLDGGDSDHREQKDRSEWMTSYLRLFDYVFENDSSAVPQDYRTPDGFGLGKWVHNQRTAYRARRRPMRGAAAMPDRRVELLEQVPGWQWKQGKGRPRVRSWRDLL